MPPLFMTTEHRLTTPGSLSAEEGCSNTLGSLLQEGNEDGQMTGQSGVKRKEKNRDAARKSRKRQTERADELHEELQSLEHSNSALQKEIASLERELHYYTVALEHHKPFCCHQDAASRFVSATQAADCQADLLESAAQDSASPRTADPSLSTSLNPGPQIHMPVESTSLSSSSLTTAVASSSSSSYGLFTSSCFVTAPHSDSFTTLLTPHSLFCGDSPPVISAELTTPACTVSLTTPATSQTNQVDLHKNLVSSNPPFKDLDVFLMKQASSSARSSCSQSVAENRSLVSSAVKVPQPHAAHLKENFINSNLPSSHFSPRPLGLTHRSLSVAPQEVLETSSSVASDASFNQHVTPQSASLLSLLTVPDPLSVPPTTCDSLVGSFDQTSTLMSSLVDISTDLSLSELLNTNDWILE